MGLNKYYSKRNFKVTAEPRGRVEKSKGDPIFVIQKHHASRLHYDFRLEAGGTLKSWAVPKGPSLDPHDKRLAVEVEDHPLAYANFEGDIPKGEYGGGHVIVWDRGTWTPPENVEAAIRKGRLDFTLHGVKLHGDWSLIRIRGKEKSKHNWLLFKRNDEAAKPGYDIVMEEPNSVMSKKRPTAIWHSNRKASKSKASAQSPAKKKVQKRRKNVKAPPDFVAPQLAQLVDVAPEGEEWIHEIKYDGYRTLARIEGDNVQLLTRAGLDWTSKYGSVSQDLIALRLDNAVLDGEIVWVDENGHTDFQGLQTALQEKKWARIVYYVFDLLFLNGEDFREHPLIDRKIKLKEILEKSTSKKVLYSDHFDQQGRELFQRSCELQLEGIVSKLANAPYESGRSSGWQKTKCQLRQEFVIGGFSESDKERPFGALLMGVYDKNKKLRYVGRVGTGYSARTMETLAAQLKKIETHQSPFNVNSPRERENHFVKPKLVAEVEFKTWTSEGVIRQGAFKGLRKDKDPKTITVEIPKMGADKLRTTSEKITKPKLKMRSKSRTKAKEARKSSFKKQSLLDEVKISHPERVIYPKTKTTKMEVVEYYDSVAHLLLPFIEDRPVSIVRCQGTTAKDCFFQKHVSGSRIVGVDARPVQYKEKKGSALAIDSHQELLALIQGGTLEIHAWGSRFAHIHEPDVLVFDLDPESDKLWPLVVDTAHYIRDVLDRLNLQSFVKVTGGKGLHVQVPFEPRYDFDVVKGFTKNLMQVLVSEAPDKYTVNMIKANRKNRIFLDYLRNGYGATAVVPYSLRAREKPAVALPISWKEVTRKLKPNGFLYNDVVKLIQKRKDPWAEYWTLRQRIQVLEKK